MKLKNRTFIPEFKQLSIAIIGTAIGVGLTFFADKMVENNHRKAAQRETAIMAVCDINEIVQGLKDVVQIEDSLFKVAMYVSAHQELIDSLSMDTTMSPFWSTIIAGMRYKRQLSLVGRNTKCCWSNTFIP